MAQIENGGPATGIPEGENHDHAWGMSVRQFYKAAAITGLLAGRYSPMAAEIAEMAAEIADYALEEDKDFGESL